MVEPFTGLNSITGGYMSTFGSIGKQAASIGGKMYLGMVGGGKRRKLTKRIRSIAQKRISSMKKAKTKYNKKKRMKRKKKTKQAKKEIIKSIEYGKPISKKSFDQLSPSMKTFLAGIEDGSRSGSTIHFSDFKSVPNKKKNKKTNSRPRTRGGQCDRKRRRTYKR